MAIYHRFDMVLFASYWIKWAWTAESINFHSVIKTNFYHDWIGIDHLIGPTQIESDQRFIEMVIYQR